MHHEREMIDIAKGEAHEAQQRSRAQYRRPEDTFVTTYNITMGNSAFEALPLEQKRALLVSLFAAIAEVPIA